MGIERWGNSTYEYLYDLVDEIAARGKPLLAADVLADVKPRAEGCGCFQCQQYLSRLQKEADIEEQQDRFSLHGLDHEEPFVERLGNDPNILFSELNDMLLLPAEASSGKKE